jgi:Fuc2NAc and GlcNAc transferase
MLWLAFPMVALFSFMMTLALRRYALAHGLMDLPNARSSHTCPTPKGGGVAIVLSFLPGILVLYFAGMLPLDYVMALLGAGSFTALNGFRDDLKLIPVRWRLLGHLLAACWVLYWLGGLAPVIFFGLSIQLDYFGYVIGAFFLVGMLNLYNFMDGIDGIAAVEAMTVGAGGAFLYWLGGEQVYAFGPVLLSFAVLGFLCWNYPPAKIFMGDVGSGFLGITFGVFVLQAAEISSNFFFSWLILLGVFIVDATLTLVRRFLRGEKVYEAHRNHAYQFASRYYGSHLPVAVATGMINVFWLLPVAFLVVGGQLEGIVGLLVGYLPLCLLAVKFRAGESDVIKRAT